MKKEIPISFADFLCPIVRKIKSVFFTQMDTLIDWRLISNIINKRYCPKKCVKGLFRYAPQAFEGEKKKNEYI